MGPQKIFVASTNLQERGHGAEAVPQHGGEVTHHLPLLAQLQQRSLPSLGTGKKILELHEKIFGTIQKNILNVYLESSMIHA